VCNAVKVEVWTKKATSQNERVGTGIGTEGNQTSLATDWRGSLPPVLWYFPLKYTIPLKGFSPL
jgi:hypothetical protein